MGWNKLGDHQFTYNEGSLNFTLTGGAFHDDDGDGAPDGVVFQKGRPVFMNVKDFKDFHFDVPRGYLVVNGKEYKLLDLDNNAENGEELQLFDENKGFPEGNDRTNPKAYKKVSAHQFTYNEGSLNYTLTGGAFNDNDGDGIPDGVQIIGSKPCFGKDGTVFDTSVENFHFKVPSGSLVVNGENYSLAELDGNPNNGYELVIPEHASKMGWSKIDNGWIYRRPSDNDSTNIGVLKLFGENVVDGNGDGEPDGITVPVIRMVEIIDGVRTSRVSIKGLNGDVRFNNPNYSLGVYNDNNYNFEIVKRGGNVDEFRLSNVSPGAVVAVNNNVTIIETDGDGKINVLADKPFMLNGKKIDVTGQKYLTLNIKNNEVASMKTEELGWTHKGDKLTFTGRPNNDPSQKVKFTLSGNDLNVDNLKVSVFRKVKGVGISVGIDGLSGEVKVNGKPLGISNDDNYGFHFTPIIDPNISAEHLPYAQSFELLNISSGANISSPGSWIIIEGDGKYHFSDGEYFISDKPVHSPAEAKHITVNNGGKGSDVEVKDGNIFGEGVSMVFGAVEVVGEVVETVVEAAEAFFGKESRSWKKLSDNSFQFRGFDERDPENVVDFTLSGKKIIDKNNDGIPDGITVGDLRSVQGGVFASIQGLNGEVSLNGKPLGIKNDDNYEFHFAPKINDDATLEQVAYLKTLCFLNISPGAEISAQNSLVFLEGDGQYLFADGNYRVSPLPVEVGSANQQLQNLSIDNGGRGAKVVVNGDKFGTVQYLSNYFGLDLNDLTIPQRPAMKSQTDFKIGT